MKVLDKNGKELREGSRVRRPGMRMVGKVNRFTAYRDVEVNWLDGFDLVWFSLRRCFPRFWTFRAPDLELLPATPQSEED